MSGIGSIIGWVSSLAATEEIRSSRGGTRGADTPAVAEAVGCWPSSATPFVFVLWLLQFMLPTVIVARIFGLRGLTLRAANTQAVLLGSALFGGRTLKVSDRALHIEHGGRPELELPLSRIAGLEVRATWLTQGIVVHSPALRGGRLALWVADPEAVATAIQRAAAGSREAK